MVGFPTHQQRLSRDSGNGGDFQRSRAWLNRFDAHLHGVAWREFLAADGDIDLLHHLREQDQVIAWKTIQHDAREHGALALAEIAQEPVASPVVINRPGPAQCRFDFCQDGLDPLFIIQRLAALQIGMQLPV